MTALKDADILYEDNHIIAVNKPAGLLSQPTNQEEDSLETRVKAWIKEKYNKPGNVFVGVIHRLDKPVSGIVLFAKTSKALSRLNDSIRSHKMQKVYVALVEGAPKEMKGSLTHFLKQGDHCSLISDARDPEAKQAILHYEVLAARQNATLLQVILETGRYHQIRCQCAAMGFPIVGDARYGAKQRLKNGDGIALHHIKLSFPHPVSQAFMTVETSLPDSFVATSGEKSDSVTTKKKGNKIGQGHGHEREKGLGKGATPILPILQMHSNQSLIIYFTLSSIVY